MRSPYTQLYIHVVWATWNRQPLVTPATEAVIYAAIQAKCSELKCELIAIGGDLDHVHLLVRLAPSVSMSQLVGEVKGASSHLMTHAVGYEFKWQGGYGAFSVSRTGLAAVTTYVQNQKEHHASRRTYAEWEKCYQDEAIMPS